MNVRSIHSLVTELVADAEDEPADDTEPLTKEVVACKPGRGRRRTRSRCASPCGSNAGAAVSDRRHAGRSGLPIVRQAPGEWPPELRYVLGDLAEFAPAVEL